MRVYENLGCCSNDVKTYLSDCICGICHDENYWYVAQGSSIYKIPVDDLEKKLDYVEKRQSNRCSLYRFGAQVSYDFYKYYKSSSSTEAMGLKIDGVVFGDIDCCKGFLFVPVYFLDEKMPDSQILVFSTKNFNLIWKEILEKKDNVRFKKMKWCAVNPQDGCLYTSDAFVSSSFAENKSPVMAYKVNFDGLEQKCGPIFSCVNKNGILLKRKVKINTSCPETVSYEIYSEIQGGCFDPFDTLYLCSGTGPGVIHDGINAFALQREIESTVDEYIRNRAYYIWQEKGSPLQSEADKKKDWFEAVWQIGAVVQSGLMKYDGPAYAGLACVKENASDSTDESLIVFFFERSLCEEIRGITYWDIRRYIGNADDGVNVNYGNLHALKIQNTAPTTFSLQNYALKEIESFYEIINYDPKYLSVKYNKVSKRWAIVSKDYIPIKAFETQAEAKNALPVFSQFKSLVIIGRCNSNEEEHDLCYDFLYDRASSSAKLDGVKKNTLLFDFCSVINKCCVAKNKWLSDCAVFLVLVNLRKATSPLQQIILPVHNKYIGSLIVEIIKTNSSFSTLNGGCLNYILASSKRQKDNLYWFD